MCLESVPVVPPVLPPDRLPTHGRGGRARLLRSVRHPSEPSGLKMSELSLILSGAPSALVASLHLGRTQRGRRAEGAAVRGRTGRLYPLSDRGILCPRHSLDTQRGGVFGVPLAVVLFPCPLSPSPCEPRLRFCPLLLLSCMQGRHRGVWQGDAHARSRQCFASVTHRITVTGFGALTSAMKHSRRIRRHSDSSPHCSTRSTL